MTQMIRVVTAIVLVLTSTLLLDGCGRKEKLTPPRGADYPRQYPRE